jgi:hypothetical protein
MAAAPPPLPSERRAAALAVLRAQSSAEAVARSSLEAGIAGAFALPAFAAYFFFDGMLAARFPRPAAPGAPPARAPAATFPALLGAATRSAASGSTRALAWVVLATAGAAVCREVARVGPRFQEPDVAAGDARVAASGAAGGAGAAALVTADWARAMGGPRRAVLIAAAAAAGFALPAAVARIGPRVKKTLAALSPPPDGAYK